MNALRLFLFIVLVAFAVTYGTFMRNLLDQSWLLFAVISITFPLALAWVVGSEEDKRDFYKIRDWIAAKLRLRR